MKAVLIEKYGPPEVLRYTTVEDRGVQAGEVRIVVRAAGVNFADIFSRLGLYPDAPKPPFIPGLEVSGEIEKVDLDVKGLQEGQRVMALTRSGGYAEKVCVLAAQVAPVPPGMGFELAAAFPVNYLTAYHMLFKMGNVRSGERVLIHAAAGGVGLAAVDLAKVAGAEIFGTASAAKFDFLRARGVHHLIDYHTQDFEEEVRHLTNGEGVDIVLDAVGGSSFKKSYRLLRSEGRLMIFGFSKAITGPTRNYFNLVKRYWEIPRFHPLSMMRANRAVLGVHLGRLRPETIRSEYQALFQLYGEGRLRIHVDKRFSLPEAPDAHRYIQERKNVGKVLLIP